MTPNDVESVIEKILLALDEEREIIRSGRLTGLADLVEQREAAIALLDAPGAEMTPQIVAGVEEIAERARRNAALLEAAIEGVKAAEKRLAQIYEARDTLGTYERDGTKSTGPVSSGKIERRA